MSTPGSTELKINCHDPRGHQAFLQLSNDMQHWEMHVDNSSWWLEREKQCNGLFQQYGYDLQSGVWYCLIASQRSGWKGMASASVLLANGFAKQQVACWPPLAAVGLRRQILDNYCRQLLPLIYALPMNVVNTPNLQQLLTATQQLLGHATALEYPQQNVLHQLTTWLESKISTLEQQAIAPAVSSMMSDAPLPSPPQKVPEARPIQSTWSDKLRWGITGAGVAMCATLVQQNLDSPAMLRISQKLWPNNPLVVHWYQQLKNSGDTLTINVSTQQLAQQLDELEQRLLDAEQKRKPYMTISELKTSIYNMRKTLRLQSAMVEMQLNQLIIDKNNNQPISQAALYTLSSQITALESKVLLLDNSELFSTLDQNDSTGANDSSLKEGAGQSKP